MGNPRPNDAAPAAGTDAGDPDEGSVAINPYDEVPYRSRPIEWSAPERLAFASAVHGGPVPRLDRGSVLELGCGNGANLLPLAAYRSRASFVGVDGSRSAIDVAEARRRELGLGNVRFVRADFAATLAALEGPFDFILMHGVLSWVSDIERDALFRIGATRLAAEGLLYLNYNCKPGWNIRGMVRDSLLAQTSDVRGLAARAKRAQEVAATVAASLAGLEHPYSRLLENEYRFVRDADASYVAHEFLAEHNHAYWRSELLALASGWGLRPVADADFDRASGRLPDDLERRIAACGLGNRAVEDTIDLLSYRQLHSPILAHEGAARRAFSLADVGGFFIASSLRPADAPSPTVRRFLHASGHEVEVRNEAIGHALEALRPRWPRGLRVRDVLPEVPTHASDLLLLQRHGMIDLRLVEPDDASPSAAVRACEERWGGYFTDPYHRLTFV